jgi:hypothetical protein
MTEDYNSIDLCTCMEKLNFKFSYFQIGHNSAETMRVILIGLGKRPSIKIQQTYNDVLSFK